MMEGSETNPQLCSSTIKDVKRAKVENSSMEYQQFTDNLLAISCELDKQRRIHKSNMTSNEILSNSAKAMIRTQSGEIKNFFDQLENDMVIKVDAIKVTNQQKKDSVGNKLEQLQDDLQHLMSETENKEKSQQMFKQDIKALEESLVSLRSENIITHYKYQQSKPVQEILATVTELGTIVELGSENSSQFCQMIKQEEASQETTVEVNQETTESGNYGETSATGAEKLDTKLEHSAAIHTRTKEDGQQSTITGLCIMPHGFIAVVDFGNKSVKLVDIKENKIVSVLAMQSDPHDVTKVTDNVVAVTLFYKRQIQFLTVDQSKCLSLAAVIEADHPCYGITHSDDKLTVTQHNKLETLDKKGKVLRSFASDSDGKQLFSHAKYLTLSPDLNTMYVSDYNNNTVTSLSTDGNVKAIYKDRELEMPFGLTVDRAGSVYVCGYNSSTIHMLSADLSSGTVLLDGSDGIVMPQSIAYCASQNRVYVGMWCNDTIKIYQL